MVKLIGYNDSAIKNLSSIIVFVHHGNMKYKVLCEVEDCSGHMILGRDEALRMKYVDFTHIQEQTVIANLEKNVNSGKKEQVKATNEPVRPVIQQSTDSSITIMSRHTSCPPQRNTYWKSMHMYSKG